MIIVIVASALVVAVATIAWLVRDTLLVRLFGPPEVTLADAYQDEPGGPSFDHSAFSDLLARHVDEHGWVDYEGLRADVEELNGYIEYLGRAPFDNLGRSEKLALLINAYNAFTLKLILEHYPIPSIRDIPSSRRWDDVRWNVGGHTWSLYQIENEQIRPKFREPGIHFALVCAAVGCPPLRNEAFVAERIDEQLQDQSEYVHHHRTWFQFDANRGVVRLTPLYNWYRGDFQQVDGTLLKYAARFSPELQRALNSGTTPRLEWVEYDWKLNSQQNMTPR